MEALKNQNQSIFANFIIFLFFKLLFILKLLKFQLKIQAELRVDEVL